jgi:CheY-like chemotaxis protein
MDNMKILIASDDSGRLASLSEYLKDKGFNILTSMDGASVLEIALNERPAIIIIEADLPVIDGERVFQILRNNPHTAEIPFIFMGADAVEIKGFRRDIDSLLLQPIKDEEVFRRVNRVFAGQKEEDKGTIGDKEIEGRLSHISLGDLLQILHLNRKEGVLKVSNENKEGLIYIKEGVIYNAVIGNIEKEKALFRLLSWHDGKFEFSPKPVDAAQKINRSTGNLLMEGMRQYDEWNKAKGQLPKLDSQIKLKVDISSLPKGLKPIIYEILFLVDYYPVIGDLVDHCTSPDYEVYQTLAGLIRKGVLEEIKDKGAVDKQAGSQREILTTAQALKIREKVAAKWKDMEIVNFGKIFIVSTNDNLIVSLVDSCKGIPGFSVNRQFITSPIHRENPFGDIATLKLYGGMDVVLFAVPLNENMRPLWKAFSKNMIGMMLLCDNEGMKEANQLAYIKNSILSVRRLPILHTIAAEHDIDKKQEEEFRKIMAMRRDEKVFMFTPANREKVFHIFSAFFGYLLKDEYISA